ncbi:hypothetical protein E4U42_006831 [Claviceps africana]|uniref:Nucleotide-diphospho-sugar transferase n=1 Tax=Claviceps africana TaxID=83212 RepID=A0A8K0J3V0_9HYPO|nr:hypothetical protein E4U42_006831 [Claviceps africana]
MSLAVAMRQMLSNGRLPSPKLLLLIPCLLMLYVLLPDRPRVSSKHRASSISNYGLVDKMLPTSRHAIATFLSGGEDSSVTAESFSSDAYFIATRTLVYQLLHAPDTRNNASYASNIDVVVLVAPEVPAENRQQLSREGATVIEAQSVALPSWIKTSMTRWKDQFLKLRLLQETQYNRFLFIDADSVLTAPIDGIFAEDEAVEPAATMQRLSKADERLPDQYVFAARSNNEFTGERDHPFPPKSTKLFSAGFWVAAPSQELFSYLMSIMDHEGRFDPFTMEQSLLNYAFRLDGPMPWRELHYKWSATWPNLKDLAGGVVSLHEKFWHTGPDELRDLWTRRKDEMEKFWSEKKTT